MPKEHRRGKKLTPQSEDRQRCIRDSFIYLLSVCVRLLVPKSTSETFAALYVEQAQGEKCDCDNQIKDVHGFVLFFDCIFRKSLKLKYSSLRQESIKKSVARDEKNQETVRNGFLIALPYQKSVKLFFAS